MFNPVPGNYYDAIETEMTDRIDSVISRLGLDHRTLTFTNDGVSVVFCQMEQDTLDMAKAMIELGCEFAYTYMKYKGA